VRGYGFIDWFNAIAGYLKGNRDSSLNVYIILYYNIISAKTETFNLKVKRLCLVNLKKKCFCQFKFCL